VTHLPAIYGKFRGLVAEARRRRPDAAILIDFPDFNLRLARALHKLGIPVFYFVSPQIWAWRSGRVRQIQKFVRKMIVIFPFEQEFYRKHGVEVSYVGHPLAYLPPLETSREEYARRHGLDPAREWIALLPGSRRKEVGLNLPAMLQAAEKLGSQYEYVLPVASTLKREFLQEQMRATSLPVKLTEDASAAMKFSRASVVASGTATVEAALSGTPFVVVYRLTPLTWLLGRRLVNLDTFAMVNLIAGRRVVTELIQHDFTPEKVLSELQAIIPDAPRRRQMLADLSEVRERLRDCQGGEQPVDRAAREILAGLGR
jgi:lipid-A-disaccharide synthase